MNTELVLDIRNPTLSSKLKVMLTFPLLLCLPWITPSTPEQFFLSVLSKLFKPFRLLQIAIVTCNVILTAFVGTFLALNILHLILARSA